jgi:hypothetical protein
MSCGLFREQQLMRIRPSGRFLVYWFARRLDLGAETEKDWKTKAEKEVGCRYLGG